VRASCAESACRAPEAEGEEEEEGCRGEGDDLMMVLLRLRFEFFFFFVSVEEAISSFRCLFSLSLSLVPASSASLPGCSPARPLECEERRGRRTGHVRCFLSRRRASRCSRREASLFFLSSLSGKRKRKRKRNDDLIHKTEMVDGVFFVDEPLFLSLSRSPSRTTFSFSFFSAFVLGSGARWMTSSTTSSLRGTRSASQLPKREEKTERT